MLPNMLTLVFAGLLASPVALHSARPSAQPARSAEPGVVQLSVRVKKIADGDKDRMLPAVRTRIVTTLAEHGWRTGETHQATVRLVVVLSQTEGSAASYRVDLSITSEASSLTDLAPVACSECGAAALLSMLDTQITAVAAQLHEIDDGRPLRPQPEPTVAPAVEAPAAPEPRPQPSPASRPQAEDSLEATPQRDARAGRSPMTGVGIGLAAPGAAAMLGGAIGLGVSLRARKSDPRANENTLAASAGILGVGAVLVGIGTPMILVGRTRTLGMSASVSRSFSGLTVRGRF